VKTTTNAILVRVMVFGRFSICGY